MQRLWRWIAALVGLAALLLALGIGVAVTGAQHKSFNPEPTATANVSSRAVAVGSGLNDPHATLFESNTHFDPLVISLIATARCSFTER